MATRTAVVGAGRIAEEHLTAVDRLAEARLVGVCDSNELLAGFATRRFGGRPSTSLSELLANEQPEVVHILTPAHLHVPMALESLASGAHVIVEKPIALERSDREELLAAAEDADRLVVEDHNYRFNRPMLRLTRDLAAGHLGALVELEVRIAMPLGAGSRYADRNLPSPSHRLPAGFVHEFITHLAYLAVTLAPDAQVLDVRWARRVGGHDSRFDDLDASLVAGATAVRLRFTAQAPRAEIAVRAIGTAGRADAEMLFGGYRIERPRTGSEQLDPPANAVATGLASATRGVGYVADRLRGRSAYEGLHELVRRVYVSVRNGTPPPVGHEDVRRAGDLVDELITAMPPGAAGQELAVPAQPDAVPDAVPGAVGRQR